MVLHEMRSIENMVRAMLHEVGIKLGTPSRIAFAGRVPELVGAGAEQVGAAAHRVANSCRHPNIFKNICPANRFISSSSEFFRLYLNIFQNISNSGSCFLVIIVYNSF